MDLQDCIYSII